MKEDIPKGKTPFFFILKSLSYKQIEFLSSHAGRGGAQYNPPSPAPVSTTKRL